MFINLTDKPYQNFYSKTPKTNLIVIDNGTYECRAGYKANTPSMVFRNQIYKAKDKVEIEPFQYASIKTMFDLDVITNFEVLEYQLDKVFNYVSPTQNLVFTETYCSPTHCKLTDFLFEVYNFENIQIGVDAIYAYKHNRLPQNTIVIDMSHSSTMVYVISNKIEEVYKIDFGGRSATEYLTNLLCSKFSCKKNFAPLVKHLRCADDYAEECMTIYNKLLKNDYSGSYFVDQDEIQRDSAKIAKKKSKIPGISRKSPSIFNENGKKCNKVVADKASEVSIDEECSGIDEELTSVDSSKYDDVSSELNNDEKKKALLDRKVKEAKKQKIIYFSALHRYKHRVEKGFETLKALMADVEEKLEIARNKDKYLEKLKMQFIEQKREVELREKLRKDVTNRKTYEFQIKNKEGLLTDDEQLLRQKIESLEQTSIDEQLNKALDILYAKIRNLDSEFVPYKVPTFSLMNGFSIGRQVVNVDLLKVPEIVFYPSIIGSEQMGLEEILEDISKKYHYKSVLLTGGFSQIQNLDKRIRDEMNKLSTNGKVNVARAKEPVLCAYRGAEFIDMFPVYTSSEHMEFGAEYLLERRLK